MGFTFFNTKRSEHSNQKNDKTAGEAGRPTNHGTSISRPSLFLHPLALSPLKDLYSKRMSARNSPVYVDMVAYLPHLISLADRLTEIIPEPSIDGRGAAESLLNTTGADTKAFEGSIADQIHAQKGACTLGSRPDALTLLPASSFQVSIESAVPELSVRGNSTMKNSSLNTMLEVGITEESIIAERVSAGSRCDACLVCFGKCSSCYNTAKNTTGRDLRRAGS